MSERVSDASLSVLVRESRDEALGSRRRRRIARVAIGAGLAVLLFGGGGAAYAASLAARGLPYWWDYPSAIKVEVRDHPECEYRVWLPPSSNKEFDAMVRERFSDIQWPNDAELYAYRLSFYGSESHFPTNKLARTTDSVHFSASRHDDLFLAKLAELKTLPEYASGDTSFMIGAGTCPGGIE